MDIGEPPEPAVLARDTQAWAALVTTRIVGALVTMGAQGNCLDQTPGRSPGNDKPAGICRYDPLGDSMDIGKPPEPAVLVMDNLIDAAGSCCRLRECSTLAAKTKRSPQVSSPVSPQGSPTFSPLRTTPHPWHSKL